MTPSGESASHTLYARIPADLMTRLRAHAEKKGMTLTAAAADCIQRGLARGRGSYDRGYSAGFAAAISIVDLLANAEEYSARITEIGDNFTALLREAQGEES